MRNKKKKPHIVPAVAINCGRKEEGKIALTDIEDLTEKYLNTPNGVIDRDAAAIQRDFILFMTQQMHFLIRPPPAARDTHAIDMEMLGIQIMVDHLHDYHRVLADMRLKTEFKDSIGIPTK